MESPGIDELIYERNSLKHLSMENLHFFERFVKQHIYKNFNIFSDDLVAILASKAHYEGVIYNQDIYRMTDDQYYYLLEAKIHQLKLHDKVNLVMLNIIKYVADADDNRKDEVFLSVKEEFNFGEIGGFKDLMNFLQYELFSYIYGTNREKPILPEELEYFQVTTENIFNQLKTIFGDQIVKVFQPDDEFSENSHYDNFRYSDHILSYQ